MTDIKAESYRSCQIKLSIGNETLKTLVNIPTGPVKFYELVPLFQSFCDVIVNSYQRQYKEEKGLVTTCQSGCSACCSQMVPISPMEAFYLVDMIQNLPAPQKDLILKRFEVAIDRFSEIGLLDRIKEIDQIDNPETKAELTVDYFAASVACPFLIDRKCSIYPHRPFICREFLVTSDPVHCNDPGPENVDRLKMPAKISVIAYSLNEEKGREVFQWLPLIDMFSWHAAHTQTSSAPVSGLDLFEYFMQRLSEKIQP